MPRRSDRCGSSLVDGFAPAGTRGQSSTSSTECVSTRRRPGARTRQGSGDPGVCSTSKTTRLLDEPRPGGPRSISDEQIEQVLVATPSGRPRTRPTGHGRRWPPRPRCRGPRSGWGLWRAFGLKPHLGLSTMPTFETGEKAMDLAKAMCLVSSVATAISAVLLSDDGAWCLVSLAPAGVSYASYLGAVASARSYNVAIETVTDLSRFALYDALRVAQPITARRRRGDSSDSDGAPEG